MRILLKTSKIFRFGFDGIKYHASFRRVALNFLFEILIFLLFFYYYCWGQLQFLVWPMGQETAAVSYLSHNCPESVYIPGDS